MQRRCLYQSKALWRHHGKPEPDSSQQIQREHVESFWRFLKHDWARMMMLAPSKFITLMTEIQIHTNLFCGMIHSGALLAITTNIFHGQLFWLHRSRKLATKLDRVGCFQNITLMAYIVMLQSCPKLCNLLILLQQTLYGSVCCSLFCHLTFYKQLMNHPKKNTFYSLNLPKTQQSVQVTVTDWIYWIFMNLWSPFPFAAYSRNCWLNVPPSWNSSAVTALEQSIFHLISPYFT